MGREEVANLCTVESTAMVVASSRCASGHVPLLPGASSQQEGCRGPDAIGRCYPPPRCLSLESVSETHPPIDATPFNACFFVYCPGKAMQSLSVPREGAPPSGRPDANQGRQTFAFGSGSRHPLLAPCPPPLASLHLPHLRAHLAVQQKVRPAICYHHVCCAALVSGCPSQDHTPWARLPRSLALRHSLPWFHVPIL